MLVHGLRAGQYFDPERIRFAIPEQVRDQWSVQVNFGRRNSVWVAYDTELDAIEAADLLNNRVMTGLRELAYSRRWKTI